MATILEPGTAVLSVAEAAQTRRSIRRYEPDFPPFVGLAAPERIDNPIELVHGLALGFADALREGEAGRVIAP